MTHDERISSYIDNELNAEQEQEFLISLAASEGLRKSFRSELVLKKVLHHDEVTMNPPHRLRSTVFATIGLGIAASTASKSSAAPRLAGRSFVKSLFATKMSTLITAAGISISALAGYGVHSLTEPAAPVAKAAMVQARNPGGIPAPATTVSTVTEPAVAAPAPVVQSISASSAPAVHHASHLQRSAVKNVNHTATAQKQIVGTAGGGNVSIVPPTIVKQP